VDVKTQTTWALSLVTTVLVGCGEHSAGPAAQAPAATAATVAEASPRSVAAAASTVPTPLVCPPASALAETARSVTPPAKTAKTATAKSSAAPGKLAVKRLVVAQGVKGREPVEPADSFSEKQAGKLYAFVEVENKDRAPAEITVSFEPPGGGASHGNVTLAVGAEPRWRTWAFTRNAHTVGAWTAVVKDTRGEVLARTPFEITL
jgi:hypothetical protein